MTQPLPRASHLPERAHRWKPYGVQSLVAKATYQEVLKLYKRPLKIFDYQEKIYSLSESDGLLKRFQWRGKIHDVMRTEGPERIAPEWWRMRSTARLRDYYRIEDSEGCRYWVYREGLCGDGRGGSPEWFVHGVFG